MTQNQALGKNGQELSGRVRFMNLDQWCDFMEDKGVEWNGRPYDCGSCGDFLGQDFDTSDGKTGTLISSSVTRTLIVIGG